jgi:hypothetical protein
MFVKPNTDGHFNLLYQQNDHFFNILALFFA